MIDIDKIEEWNSHNIGDDAYEAQAIVSKGDLLDIITSLRKSEKDAARYRWLRDEAVEHDLCISVSLESSEWNAFIDEAMQCSGDEK